MRKLLLFAIALMATASMSAQIVLWNGEDKEQGTDGGFWNRSTPTVVDDNGNKCLKITMADAANDWERHNTGLGLGEVDLKGLRRVSMKIKMPKTHNVLVKLGKDGSYTLNRLFWYGEINTWKTLVFEYSVGPDNDKVVDTGNTVLEIWPYENYNADNNGDEIYIDDIQLEGPMVGDVAVRTLADNALTTKQVVVTGSLSKGEYQCTWDGDWHNVAYDDYSILLSKLSSDVCFLNMTGAAVADGDGPQLRTKNPNLLILSPTDFYDTDNVIRWDGEKNVTPKMVINEANPFYTPIDFTATNVELNRKRYAGYNTFVLPFWVSATDLGATAVYTHKSGATFKKDTDEFNPNGFAGGNVPFIADYAAASDEGLNFTNKGVCTTPDNFDGSDFKGVYALQSAENLWGINGEGKLQKGGSTATIKSFHAYLADVPSSARELIFEGETTGVNDVRSKMSDVRGEFYNLAGQRVAQPVKGLYIVNGKKVVIK